MTSTSPISLASIVSQSAEERKPNEPVFIKNGRRKLCFGRCPSIRMVDQKYLLERAENSATGKNEAFGQSFTIIAIPDTVPPVALRRGIDPNSVEVRIEQKRDIQHYQNISHKNIAPLLCVISSDKLGLLEVFPLYDSDLFDYMLLNSYRSVDIRNWMRQVSEALEYLHEKRIVHSDVKIENILIRSENDEKKVALTDFGWAGEVGTFLISATSYCAPEISSFWWRGDTCYLQQVTDTELRKRYERAVENDIWSLGFAIRKLIDYFHPDEESIAVRNFLNGQEHGSQAEINKLVNDLVARTGKDLAVSKEKRDVAYCQVADTEEARTEIRDLLLLAQNMMAADPAKRPDNAVIKRMPGARPDMPEAMLQSSDTISAC
ncbi:protein kinase domain-containing protein [Endozoicomonas sp.]|uniref:protein kinase domain-containing protein n=1 Tax=Endozoicomonas sp. TaxID=1892382 RepID=UPI0028857118|nr:protein kinase [Endozoicomonas sp.]